MATVEIRNLKKSFGAATILQGADLRMEEGEFVVLVGPSGCGKSTAALHRRVGADQRRQSDHRWRVI